MQYIISFFKKEYGFFLHFENESGKEYLLFVERGNILSEKDEPKLLIEVKNF
jgi:hypothetical protein